MRTTTLELPEATKNNDDHYSVRRLGGSLYVPTAAIPIPFTPISSDTGKTQALASGMLEHPEAFARIVTQNREMRLIFQYLEAIAPTPLPVLVTGETGVGKELIAEAIHDLSCCRGKLVTVNVAGVDDDLFSDTLFGHKRGGFTGADRDRPGLIEMAAGGTLFLDEIGDLSLGSQVKLLRLLQDGKYYPIGSDTVKLTDARIIVATNQDLDLAQQKGLFRKDLYYRLRAHHVHIPPLRQRKEDIPLLVDYLIHKLNRELNKRISRIQSRALQSLVSRDWPGNIRQLENVLRRAVVHSHGEVLLEESLAESVGDILKSDTDPASSPIKLLDEVEKEHILNALKFAQGNRGKVCELLGISRPTLQRKIRKYDIEV